MLSFSLHVYSAIHHTYACCKLSPSWLLVPTMKDKINEYLLSKVLTVSVVFSTVHEVGREQGVLSISVVSSTIHEVGRESKEYLLSVLFSALYMR